MLPASNNLFYRREHNIYYKVMKIFRTVEVRQTLLALSISPLPEDWSGNMASCKDLLRMKGREKTGAVKEDQQ